MFGKVVNLSSDAIDYYRKIGTKIDFVGFTNPPFGSTKLAAAANLGISNTAKQLASGLGKVFKNPVTSGSVAGGTVAAGTGNVGKNFSNVAAAPLQGLGFGTGYGVGVRAGYELGFPSLFGEAKSAKRQQVVQQGFSGGPLFDILKVISGGGDLGTRVGSGYSGASGPDDITENFLGGSPPPGFPDEGLGFSDKIDVFKNQVLQGDPRTPSPNADDEKL